MKINAVDSYRVNNIHFEGKKNKEIQKPVHSANPIKAIPVAVLIAMSPLNAPNTNASPSPIPIEATSGTNPARPQNFIEYKNFKTDHNNIFVGLSKDKNSDKYKIWVDCNTQRLMSRDQMNGYITEYNENEYRIEDTFGYSVQSLNFDNIYVKDTQRTYQSGALADKDVCKYVSDLISKYPTDIEPRYHRYVMQMVKSGNLEYKTGANNKFRTAKENPMNFGTEMRTWEIETSKGKFRVKIYNNDGNKSNFETITIENLKLKGPELKVTELVAANSHIYNKADELRTLERYQINTSHNKAGDIAIENKELWEFIYQLMSTKQCNNASGGREMHFYHSSIESQGIIDHGEDPTKY